MSTDATIALLALSRAALRGVAWKELVHDALERLRDVTSCDVAAFYDASEVNGPLMLHEAVRREGELEALPPSDPYLVQTARKCDAGSCEIRVTAGGENRHDVAVAVQTGTNRYSVLSIGSKCDEAAPSDRAFLSELAEILSIARRAERRRRAADHLFKRSRTVFEQNPNAKMLVDVVTNRFIDVNLTAVAWYGYTREQFLAMTTSDLLAPEDVERPDAKTATDPGEITKTVDLKHRRADGSRLDAHVTSIAIAREDDNVYLMNIQDMTERNDALARALQSEAQLAHDALHDRLTGLPNRTLLNERLAAAIVRATEMHWTVAVLFIDVDQFKHVNDTMGHAAGDTLLMEIGQRLRSATRQTDCVARMGGDEFIAVFGEIAEVQHFAKVVRHLERVTAEPIRVPGGEITVTCSIGVALFPQDGQDAETLIRNADTAMYHAKRDGRATTCFFKPAMRHSADQVRALQRVV
jgi:diguanylate cyclase (GGDEF)-like protein/PAS domain S-box-containing protein